MKRKSPPSPTGAGKDGAHGDLREGPIRDRSGFPVFLGEPGRLPCGGGRYCLGSVGELRDDAELLHEAQSVPVDIAFHETRATVTPEMVMCFPVGAMPLRSPLWVPRQDQRVMTVSPSAMTSSIVK
jgi:hypothetical protein